MNSDEPIVTINDLPVKFNVRYLGCEVARGLWGMKNTRQPVDSLVTKAKTLSHKSPLPIVTLEVSTDGVTFSEMGNTEKLGTKTFNVSTISYGVQDLVYSKIFSMIIVTGKQVQEDFAFYCHCFVCDSRNDARQITYALAATFQEYGRRLRNENREESKRFTIDLRTPEEQAAVVNEEEETEA